MPIDRAAIPAKARRRPVTPWRLTISQELDGDQLQVLVHRFLAGTRYHYVMSADVYPGTTMIIGDYWGTKGRTKDLAAVATLWDQVQEEHPTLITDAVLEYRVPGDLLDETPAQLVDDLTRAAG